MIASGLTILDSNLAGLLAITVFVGMVLRTRECYRIPNENVLPTWAGIVLFPLWPSFVVIDYLGNRIHQLGFKRTPMVLRLLLITILYSLVWIPMLVSINAHTDVFLVSGVVIGSGTVGAVLHEKTPGDWYLIPALSLIPWMRL